MSNDPVAMQRDYYTRRAATYDAHHVVPGQDEHFLALAVMSGLIQYYGCNSLLDVGAGTGRTLLWVRKQGNLSRSVGVEPVPDMRARAYENGLTPDELTDGDATRLQFEDGEFDVVCCFGVLHHVPNPEKAVGELLRVARRMVFISDANNFGQGSWLGRTAKQAIRAVGLWPMANYFKTRGRGYTLSDGDGLAYSYSVFDSYPQLRRACETVHVFNTSDSKSVNPYRGASHVAVAAVKAAPSS